MEEMNEINEMLNKVDHDILGKAVREAIKVSKQSKEIGEELIDYYERSNTHEQAIANNIMIHLCGILFEDLLEFAYTTDSYTLLELDNSEATVAMLTIIEDNNIENYKAYTGVHSYDRAKADFLKYTQVDYADYKKRFVEENEDQFSILGKFAGTEINIMTANI